MSIKPISDTTQLIPDSEKELSKTREDLLFDVFKTSPLAHKLWTKVAQDREDNGLKPLKLKIMPAPNKGHLAWCKPSLGIIYISKTDPTSKVQKEAHEDPKKLHMLLLELCNMSQSSEFLAMSSAVKKGRITSPVDYAKQMETLEYQSCKMHDDIIEASLKEDACKWDSSVKSFKYNWTSLPQHLKAQQSTKHTERYKEAFDHLVKDKTAKSTKVDQLQARSEKPKSETLCCIIS